MFAKTKMIFIGRNAISLGNYNIIVAKVREIILENKTISRVGQSPEISFFFSHRNI